MHAQPANDSNKQADTQVTGKWARPYLRIGDFS